MIRIDEDAAVLVQRKRQQITYIKYSGFCDEQKPFFVSY
jgi:hypothetical protein